MIAAAAPAQRAQLSSDASVLLDALSLIERTVLPRTMVLNGAGEALYLDLSHQAVQLLPRVGDLYATDLILRSEAPAAFKLLSQRRAGVRKQIGILAEHRSALIACAARALMRCCAQGQPLHGFAAVQANDISADFTIAAPEIYRAARTLSAKPATGALAIFYERARSHAAQAWLIDGDGWIVDELGGGDTIAELRAAAAAARSYRTWLETSEAGEFPSQFPILGQLADDGSDKMWGVAADSTHLAYLRVRKEQWREIEALWPAEVEADAATGAIEPSVEPEAASAQEGAP